MNGCNSTTLSTCAAKKGYLDGRKPVSSSNGLVAYKRRHQVKFLQFCIYIHIIHPEYLGSLLPDPMHFDPFFLESVHLQWQSMWHGQKSLKGRDTRSFSNRHPHDD